MSDTSSRARDRTATASRWTGRACPTTSSTAWSWRTRKSNAATPRPSSGPGARTASCNAWASSLWRWSGVLVWLVLTKQQVKAFVQTVQVTEEGRLVQLGVPQDLYDYTPPDGVYMEMVAQWVRWTRWRGDDDRMTRVQWAWAYRHTCGIAHKWLKAPGGEREAVQAEQQAGGGGRQECHEDRGPGQLSGAVGRTSHGEDTPRPSKPRLWTGTFTVGRIALTTMDDLLDNRLGVCITAYELVSPE